MARGLRSAFIVFVVVAATDHGVVRVESRSPPEPFRQFVVIFYFAAFGFNHWWFTAGTLRHAPGSAGE